MPPLGFNNTFAMVVRHDENQRTLSGAAQARAWTLGNDERNAKLVAATAWRADRIVEVPSAPD